MASAASEFQRRTESGKLSRDVGMRCLTTKEEAPFRDKQALKSLKGAAEALRRHCGGTTEAWYAECGWSGEV